MTTTYTAQALLNAAIEALESANRSIKKATGEPAFRLATVLDKNGVTLRDLKNWHKDFKAKQATAGEAPAQTKPATKAPVLPKLDGPKPGGSKTTAATAAPELKGTDVKGEVVLLGRAKETVVRVSRNKTTDVREAVTATGLRIALADIERNNRGNLRVKDAELAKYTSKAPEKAPAPKAPAAKVKDEAFELETTTTSKAQEKTGERVYPLRALTIKPSGMLTAATYDRTAQTLYVTFKDGAHWAYEGVRLADVRALENATSAGKHFIQHLRDAKKGHMVKSVPTTPKTESKPAGKTAEQKPAPKAPAAKAPVEAAPISTTRLRAEGFYNGRKHMQVDALRKNKETGERIVVAVGGERFALAHIIEVKGKFRVSDLAQISDAMKGAGIASTSTKAPAKAAQAPVKPAKQAKANFAEAEAKQQHTFDVKVTREMVKANPVRVVKGSKEKMVNVIRVVSREGVSTAITEARGAIPFAQIVMLDNQLTFCGKLTAAEFNAL